MLVDSTAAVERPVARPLFITTSRRPLFGWHHAPPPHARRSAGIVLCPALGYEYMSAYRTWRILAERLAALGFDTLRLDYDGTGNSAGDVTDPNRVDAWLRSIACVTAEARTLVGRWPGGPGWPARWRAPRVAGSGRRRRRRATRAVGPIYVRTRVCARAQGVGAPQRAGRQA